jgi:hypothetical protein
MKRINNFLLLGIFLTTAFLNTARAQVGTCPGTPVDHCDLVNNGDFETNTGLPVNLGYDPSQMGLACPWTNYPCHVGTSDYFSSLVAPGNTFWIPTNVVGTEAAYNGNGYAGVATRYASYAPGFREYLVEQLRCPLIAGVTYHLSYHVSLADRSEWGGEIKAAISPTIPCWPAYTVPTLPAGTIYSPNYLLNTTAQKTGWSTVNYTFVASGGEQYIILGNFNPTDATGATPFPGSGYVQGAYVYVDGVSLTVNSPLVITATPSTVLCGGTTVLSNNYNALISWSGGSWSCGSCVNPTTAPLNSTTTYSGTITYCSGCTETATTTVTVTPLTVSATATPTSISPPSTTSSSLVATPAGGTGPYTYSWTPAGSLNNPSISNPIATPTVTTVYTCVVTNAAGCSATTTTTVTVVMQSLCLLTYDYDLGSAHTSSAFSGAPAVTNKNIHVSGALTVDNSINFIGCNLVMDPGSSITVMAGATLTIMGGTHLYSCLGMWNGITALSGSVVTISQNAIIEDALRGVLINSGANATVETCVFNRNYTAVELAANTASTSPILMDRCVITSRDIPFATVASSNPSYSTVWTNVVAGTYPSLNMETPYTGFKSIYGVLATDVNSVKVGSDFSSGFTNYFENLCHEGISLVRTNAIIYNNQFRNITNNATCFSCLTLIGAGIYATGSTTANYSITVGGTGSNQPNGFSDVKRFVDARDYQMNTVLNNIGTNSSSSIATYGGFGTLGVYIFPSPNNVVDIENNNMTNCATGIQVYRGTANSVSTTSLKIDNNTVAAISPGAGFCNTAINVFDYSAGTSVVPVPSEINFNTILKAGTCISLTNVKKATDVLSNSCQVLYATTGSINGIKANGCQNTNITQNHVKYDIGAAAYHGGNTSAYGIYLINSSSMIVKCNTIEDAAYSMVFDGACSSPHAITQNWMRRAQIGIMIINPATVIGTQGTTAVPSNNYWDMTATPAFAYEINTTAPISLVTTFISTAVSVNGSQATYPNLTFVTGPVSLASTSNLGPAACGAVPARFAAPEETPTDATEMNAPMSIFPNPNNGSFTVQTNSTEAKDIFVYDVMGKEVAVLKQVSDSSVSIDIADQPTGIYIVRVVGGNSVQTQRIIKQ